MKGMPRVKLLRRAGPFTTVLALWDVWHRLSPRQRRWVVKQARRHGPRLAKRALDARRRKRDA
jgi:hypothetical protein